MDNTAESFDIPAISFILYNYFDSPTKLFSNLVKFFFFVFLFPCINFIITSIMVLLLSVLKFQFNNFTYFSWISKIVFFIINLFPYCAICNWEARVILSTLAALINFEWA